MADLEAFDGGFDERIVSNAHAGDLIEVARGYQTLAQRLNRLRLRADLEVLDVRHRNPAAARDNALVTLNRFFGRLHGRRRKHRRRFAPDRNSARGLIALPPLGLIVRLARPGQNRRNRRRGDRQRRQPAQKPAPIRTCELKINHGIALPRRYSQNAAACAPGNFLTTRVRTTRIGAREPQSLSFELVKKPILRAIL